MNSQLSKISYDINSRVRACLVQAVGGEDIEVFCEDSVQRLKAAPHD
ncbi:MAG: hypothetical protein ACM3ZE_23550 [Myxococcales bacterium]